LFELEYFSKLFGFIEMSS